ncbi:287_t:CDS:10 [Paraglomus brasilianum]|uniref:V-type proton ATPase subunit a n=1 Tax=Paraglomus brasilianum TaxID=144538 RepID=A0A9N8ZIX4_9GLOM|nr:287_t:CDS:10 [Paraglomus brasilianum]
MTYSSLFRSEEMSLIQLYIPSEMAQPTVAELGELGLIQFRDLNPDVNAFQRAFVSQIRRFDEMERRLRFFTVQIEKLEIPIRPLTGDASAVRARSVLEIDELEEQINVYERRITQLNNSYESMQKRYLRLTEQRHVLKETGVFLEQAESRQEDIRQSFDEPTTPLLGHADLEQGPSGTTGFNQLNLGFVTGVIPRKKMQTFERVLWRVLRGNLYLNYAEIDEPIVDPSTDEVVEKNVFIIFAHGKVLLDKIRKISESLGATLYPVDDSPDRRRASLLDITTQIEDLSAVIQTTNNARRTELTKIAENLTAWMTIIKKEKAVYHTMNLFNYDVTRKCLIAEGWCPRNDLPKIHGAIRTATENFGSNVSAILNELRTTKEPPTFHRVNKFTSGFQEIVDAYGVAKYREVNPGLFTIITFPFLFAVMFGDFGHGFLLTLAGLYLILNEKKFEREKLDEIFEMFFGGRYIILLMGLFSIYTGLIYNDIFSRAVQIADSGFEWQWPENYTVGQAVEAVQVGVYPFGVDPAWHGADNSLIFINSYKMKMSVVFGVIQMSFGIALTVFNYTYFKKKLSIWTEFLPQMLFMQSIFGYLVFTIIYKWSMNWSETDSDGQLIRHSPPGLLNMLIYMFLQPGTVAPDDELYPGQANVQLGLLIVAFICIPWMLLAKPLILRHEHHKIRAMGYRRPLEDTSIATEEDIDFGASSSMPEEMHEEEGFDFGEHMIHQVIHTIEFCLGCISNTASYLRLWALSLAHAQLSAVLWDMTLKTVLGISGVLGAFALVVAFALWFSLTIGILLIMEGLSAFLHALRLHWVEFNNKFYEGTGIKFEPFSFKSIVKDKDD